jgi:hypothetical protein
VQDVNWSQVLVFGLVALVVFALGIGVLLLLFGGGFRTMGWGMMGPRGMRGGWCPWCGGSRSVGLGWLGVVLGLSLGCLLPVALVGLVVVGAVLLMRNR